MCTISGRTCRTARNVATPKAEQSSPRTTLVSDAVHTKLGAAALTKDRFVHGWPEDVNQLDLRRDNLCLDEIEKVRQDPASGCFGDVKEPNRARLRNRRGAVAEPRHARLADRVATLVELRRQRRLDPRRLYLLRSGVVRRLIVCG